MPALTLNIHNCFYIKETKPNFATFLAITPAKTWYDILFYYLYFDIHVFLKFGFCYVLTKCFKFVVVTFSILMPFSSQFLVEHQSETKYIHVDLFAALLIGFDYVLVNSYGGCLELMTLFPHHLISSNNFRLKGDCTLDILYMYCISKFHCHSFNAHEVTKWRHNVLPRPFPGSGTPKMPKLNI